MFPNCDDAANDFSVTISCGCNHARHKILQTDCPNMNDTCTSQVQIIFPGHIMGIGGKIQKHFVLYSQGKLFLLAPLSSLDYAFLQR